MNKDYNTHLVKLWLDNDLQNYNATRNIKKGNIQQ